MNIIGVTNVLSLNGKILTDVKWPYNMNFDEKIVYEVIRVINGKPLFFDEHMERIINSVSLMGYEFDNLREEISSYIREFILNGNLKNNNIKIFIGNIDDNHYDLVIFYIKSFYPDRTMYENGVDTRIISFTRDNPSAKILNDSLTERVNKIREEEDVFEVLLANSDDVITEGSRSNIFFVDGNKIILSNPKKVLKGITMGKVIESISECGFEMERRDVLISELENFKGCFMTGTSNNILPIRRIDGIFFNSSKNIIIKELVKKFNLKMQMDLEGYK